MKARQKNWCLYAVMGAGALLRLFYVIFSTIYDRQYDIGMIDLDAGHTVSGGHLAYIQYIYENGLPDFDPVTVYQFHHPPLHHAVCAAWMKFCSLFIRNTDILEESIQSVPFVCSLLILWVLYEILKQFQMRERTVCFVMAVFAFHPSLILLSGSVNNDCMALLFTLLIVHQTIDWSRRLRLIVIVRLALCMGLGMLVKQNVAEMAFPVGAVFLYILIRSWKNAALRARLIGQLALFGLISVPIGMSFYVRNLVRFGTSLLWVYELPADSWQYTGNVPLVNRFLWPIPSEMLDNLLHFRLGCSYNVWMQLIRTSVLGEWDMASVGAPVKLLAVLLMLLGAALALLALCCFVKVFVADGIRMAVRRLRRTFRKNGAETDGAAAGIREDTGILCEDATCTILFVVGYVVSMACYLIFAYRYPQQCSMHFRYIEITLLFPAVALGLVRQAGGKRFRALSAAVLAGFALCSTAMVCVWCLL